MQTPPPSDSATVFNPRIPLKRAPYAAIGFSLAVLKWVGDVLIATFAISNTAVWMPSDYLQPWRSPIMTHISSTPVAAMLMLVWLLPFVYVGVVFTMRRALDAGWSPWWALAFFVPYLNYAVMLALCLWPSSDKYAIRDRVQQTSQPLAGSTIALSAAIALAFCALMFFVTVELKGSYAFGVFVGTPFVTGTIAGFFVSHRSRPTNVQILQLCAAINIMAVVAMFAAGFEGAICIVMALPLTMALTFAGAMIGRDIASSGRAIQRTGFSALLLLPLAAFAEPAHTAHHLLHAVHTSIEVNATPERIWPRLVQFRPIAAPTEWYFRLGIAYPTVSYTEGAGVGAMRYCGFSTGDVAERITEWKPEDVLAFDVESQPAPMVELSPYKDLDPPHLHGYVNSKKGEFRLVKLADGRTRIDGTSWYEIDMQPEAYWSAWVDASVHAIHRRVLTHIKEEVEAGTHGGS
jgi:hypothetical protein